VCVYIHKIAALHLHATAVRENDLVPVYSNMLVGCLYRNRTEQVQVARKSSAADGLRTYRWTKHVLNYQLFFIHPLTTRIVRDDAERYSRLSPGVL
jgi:hypothetical protein